MADKITKVKVSRKRQRNYIAKALRENPAFKQKVINDKRKDADPKDDYSQLDEWLVHTERFD